MKRLVAVVALLAAAGCGASTPRLPAPEGVADNDPRVVECRREAARTPARREIARRRGMGMEQQLLARQETETAINVAYHACLEEAGFPRAGGVEAVQRPIFRWPTPGAPPPPEPSSVVPPAAPAPTGY